jgi:hypothetical protein
MAKKFRKKYRGIAVSGDSDSGLGKKGVCIPAYCMQGLVGNSMEISKIKVKK